MIELYIIEIEKLIIATFPIDNGSSGCSCIQY